MLILCATRAFTNIFYAQQRKGLLLINGDQNERTAFTSVIIAVIVVSSELAIRIQRRTDGRTDGRMDGWTYLFGWFYWICCPGAKKAERGGGRRDIGQYFALLVLTLFSSTPRAGIWCDIPFFFTQRQWGLICCSVGTILGIDSQRLDSFDDFCGRARRLDSKSKNRFWIGHDSFAKIGKKPPKNPSFFDKIALKYMYLLCVGNKLYLNWC
jgi:hypothetical protein